MSKICKWSESYVSFGFTKVTPNGRDCVQCLHCSVVMLNASLRPFKPKSHRDKKHLQRKNNDIDALSAKRVKYDLEAALPLLRFTVEKKSLLFNVATRWHIELQSVRSHVLSLRNLSSHVQKKWLKSWSDRGQKRKPSKFRSLMIPFADGLTTWLLMCASKFASKSSKVRSRLAFNWVSLPIAL